MRRIGPFQGICCDPSVSWVCVMCGDVVCGEHEPSPGEVTHICERCIPQEDA